MYVCMYACMYVRMYACMYVCIMYVCMFVYRILLHGKDQQKINTTPRVVLPPADRSAKLEETRKTRQRCRNLYLVGGFKPVKNVKVNGHDYSLYIYIYMIYVYIYIYIWTNKTCSMSPTSYRYLCIDWKIHSSSNLGFTVDIPILIMSQYVQLIFSYISSVTLAFPACSRLWRKPGQLIFITAGRTSHQGSQIAEGRKEVQRLVHRLLVSGWGIPKSPWISILNWSNHFHGGSPW